MQTLDVISVNIWQIVISLLNLLIIFVILKKFLFAPVNNMLQKRREQIDMQYESASKAQQEAIASKNEWEIRLSNAQGEADELIKNAAEKATKRSDKILADARDKADGIVRRAKNDAELEIKKAQDGIKREIVDVSAVLTEKMLGREINEQDHRSLIDSFIEKIGEDDAEK